MVIAWWGQMNTIVNEIPNVFVSQELIWDLNFYFFQGLTEKLNIWNVFLLQNLDLTKRKVIYQGSLSWRIANKTKLVELHVLLLEDIIILLQKVHEKYLLQFFNTNSGTNERGHVFSPVIRMSTVLVRPNAVGKFIYLLHSCHNNRSIMISNGF